MAFSYPTIKDLAQRARNAFRTEMPGTDAWVWPNNVYVAAKVYAGIVFEIFGKLAWIDKQRFAMTATGYELERHGLEYGIGRNPATYATGPVDFVGTSGTDVPAGSTCSRSDGVTYTTISDFTIGDVATTATVTCTVTGTTGNSIYGTPLTVNVDGVTATVNEAGIGGGNGVETDASLRQRILDRKRNPPQGGCASDYVAWAKTIPGVTRVWVEGGVYGAGSVAIWFLMDDTYSFGIPQPSDVATVQAYIDQMKPVTARAYVIAPSIEPLDIIVANLTPDTATLRTQVADEISNTVFRNGSVATPNNPVNVYRLQLWEAAAVISGVTSGAISGPGTDLSMPVGTVPAVRSVTFVTQ